MTTNAVVKVADTLFKVSSGDPVGIVLVAAVTGVGLQVVGMAGLAGTPAAMVKWEAVRLVELSRRPGLSVMAGGAIAGEQPGMESWITVAGCALLRCTFEDIVHMAFAAFNIGMRSGQLESSFRVVEAGFLPVVWCVATGAICAKFTLVGIIFGVAGITGLRGAFEYVIDMAFVASHVGVRAG